MLAWFWISLCCPHSQPLCNFWKNWQKISQPRKSLIVLPSRYYLVATSSTNVSWKLGRHLLQPRFYSATPENAFSQPFERSLLRYVLVCLLEVGLSKRLLAIGLSPRLSTLETAVLKGRGGGGREAYHSGRRRAEVLILKYESRILRHCCNVLKVSTVFFSGLWVSPRLLLSAQILAWKWETRCETFLPNPIMSENPTRARVL